TRNDGVKVRKDKAVDIGKHIVLDQERCILCTRCIRVCDEVAKSPDLTMANRGDHEVLTTAPGRRLDNPYSLNTVDVCPVGALAEAATRLKTLLDRGPQTVGVVLSAQATNEDLYALARLAFEHLGIQRAYLAGKDEGWSDDILVSADKNPNTAGARAIGGTRL